MRPDRGSTSTFEARRRYPTSKSLCTRRRLLHDYRVADIRDLLPVASSRKRTRDDDEDDDEGPHDAGHQSDDRDDDGDDDDGSDDEDEVADDSGRLPGPSAQKIDSPAPHPPQKTLNLLAHLGDQLATALNCSPQRHDVLSAIRGGRSTHLQTVDLLASRTKQAIREERRVRRESELLNIRPRASLERTGPFGSEAV